MTNRECLSRSTTDSNQNNAVERTSVDAIAKLNTDTDMYDSSVVAITSDSLIHKEKKTRKKSRKVPAFSNRDVPGNAVPKNLRSPVYVV